MLFDLPYIVTKPAGAAGFANDNDAPGFGEAPSGTTGLALSCEVDAIGGPIACIRPLMAGGHLGAPLLTTRDGTDIIALWRGLGQKLHLPLFAVMEDGGLELFSAPMGGECHARRGGSALTGRRTRFARRRQGPAGVIAPPKHLVAHSRRG